MKKITFVLTAFCSVLLSVLTYGQDRGVVWSHGLASNETFWSGYAAAFNAERRIVSANSSLNSLDGVPVMAADLRYANRNAAGGNTIGVGHSMGGLTMREVYRQNPSFLGGIITVGSPMNGARITTALKNGDADAVALRGVNDMLAGPQTSLIGPFGLVGGLIVYLGGKAIINQYLPNVIRNARTQYQNDLGQSFIDLTPGSAYLQAAVPSSVPLPTISLYGNENAPVLYRVASSFVSPTGVRPVDDQQFVNLSNELADVYNTFYEEYQGRTIAGQVIRIFFTGGTNLYIAEQWRRGRDFIRVQADADWARLVGATRTETFSQNELVMTCTSQEYGQCFSQTCNQQNGSTCQQICNSRCYRTQWRTYTQYVQQPSDGLIDVDSQVGANRYTVRNSAWNPNWSRELLGVNHMEMQGHPEMDAAFQEIWTRALPQVPEFFRTERR